MNIKSVKGREIIDSRGNPTIEVDVMLDHAICGRASVPSGASTGQQEAVVVTDKDNSRFHGLGMRTAVEHVNQKIHQALKGKDVRDQALIDASLIALDGTSDKSNLGANAVLGASLAAAKAAAQSARMPLYQYIHGLTKAAHELSMPVPMINIINGGAHANNNLVIQEFMIVPWGFSSFSEALRCGAEVFYQLKKQLVALGFSTAVGDEGGFAPNLSSHEHAIELILQAITGAGYRPGTEVSLALDVASSEIYHEGRYHMQHQGASMSRSELIDYLGSLVKKYPIASIEDGMAEQDWQGWSQLTQQLGHCTQLVGDDIFVTNPHLLKKGIAASIANAILIKPNQVGTLTETLSAIDMAKKAGYGTIISHRSGETEDTIIADIAVGTGAGQIKTGSLCRTDRVAKYNQLLRIEEALGTQNTYARYRPVLSPA